MSDTYSWRPKEYTIPELQKFAKNHNTNLNRLIEESVTEKIHKMVLAEKGDVADLLTFEISKVVNNFLGIRLIKPDQATHEKIIAKVLENNKKGNWVSDEARRPSETEVRSGHARISGVVIRKNRSNNVHLQEKHLKHP